MRELTHATSLSPRRRAAVRRLTVVALSMVMFIASPVTAWAATSITLTLTRHAQSLDNVIHVLGTVAPGPDLSPTGRVQAETLRDTLVASGIDYDAIYASTLVRTQQTAAPYADYRGIPIIVLDGLREVRAGADEGAITKPIDARMQNYIDVQNAWRNGRILTPMPQDPDPLDPNPLTNANGDFNGIVFNDRTNTAIQKIYWDAMNRYPDFTADALNPEANPLAFSHNGTITSWVLMNVENPDFALIAANSLKNTGQAVVVGNPEDGWTLVRWAGLPVSPNPSLGTALFVTLRDYTAVWQRAAWNVEVAAQSGNAGQVIQALGTGLGEVTVATVRLPGEIVRDFTDAVINVSRPAESVSAQSGAKTAAAMPAPAAVGSAPAQRPRLTASPAEVAATVSAAAARRAKAETPLKGVADKPAVKRASAAGSEVPQQRRTGGTEASAAAASARVRDAA